MKTIIAFILILMTSGGIEDNWLPGATIKINCDIPVLEQQSHVVIKHDDIYLHLYLRESQDRRAIKQDTSMIVKKVYLTKIHEDVSEECNAFVVEVWFPISRIEAKFKVIAAKQKWPDKDDVDVFFTLVKQGEIREIK